MLVFTHPLFFYDLEKPAEINNFLPEGTHFWNNDWVSAFSAVRHTNGLIYVTTNLNSLYEIDTSERNVRPLSRFSTWAFCRLVSYENELLCFGSRLTVVDPATGSSKPWIEEEGLFDSYWSRTRAAVVHLSKIYVATQTNSLYCIGRDKNPTLIESKTDWSTCSALLSANDTLYATLGSGLFAIDTTTGDATLIAEVKSQIKCGTVGADGCLYVVTKDGYLYKLESDKLVDMLQKTPLGVASTMA
ncbi:hypothetical protein K450DRAFT_272024 [Umbelopsis ramanniana AG]|uniref:Uncharacterized protein n=1 Tax=Umbelopsis ramanniana AG TaxID=1314678 RepID=A0AAD5EA56_UMBRA|nr:uncharacterized protein K450DRAFT_272024 [Umbelopsis ramanniana AG]KAI8579484.1 hypothetical protein K450DRAFT_272024 [Umbelopsis ramanniana AG]